MSDANRKRLQEKMPRGYALYLNLFESALIAVNVTCIVFGIVAYRSLLWREAFPARLDSWYWLCFAIVAVVIGRCALHLDKHAGSRRMHVVCMLAGGIHLLMFVWDSIAPHVVNRV